MSTYTTDDMELAHFVGSGNSRLSETEKIRRGLYPEFDEEMISRKIRKVCGFLRGGMNITNKQWREIMVECWKESKVLGRKPIRGSMMNMLRNIGIPTTFAVMKETDPDRQETVIRSVLFPPTKEGPAETEPPQFTSKEAKVQDDAGTSEKST